MSAVAFVFFFFVVVAFYVSAVVRGGITSHIHVW
jgi:hypothetical protein